MDGTDDSLKTEQAAVFLQQKFRDRIAAHAEYTRSTKHLYNKSIWNRSWICGFVAKCLFFNMRDTREGQNRSYAIVRKILMIVFFLTGALLTKPMGDFVNDEGNVIREDLLGELREDTDVVAARLMGNVPDHYGLQPVINGEDLVHIKEANE